MPPKEIRLLVEITIATIITLTLTRMLLQRVIAAKISQDLCSEIDQVVVCYDQPERLSGEATTTIATSPNGY